MAVVTITVDDALMAWIERRVETGGYADLSAYLCDLLRQDMQANGSALPDLAYDSASERTGVRHPSAA